MEPRLIHALLLSAAATAGPYDDGIAALQAGRATEAAALLTTATTADPGNTAAWWELGFARWSLRDWAGAGTAWGKVAALDPQRADLAFWQGAARTRAHLASLPIPTAAIPTAPEGPILTFTAVGDTMMGSDLKRGAAGLAPDPGALFPHVATVIRAADVAFVNLEGPIADGLPSTKCGPGSTSCYAFRTPTRYAQALTDAGFDLAQLANNHAWDLGVAGQQATMHTLDGLGIAHSGPFGDVGRIERDGRVIALVAAHSGECCLNVNELDEIRRAVGEADTWADIVVFAYHGGAEGADARHVPHQTEIAWGERRGDVEALAHAAVDAGADLVIGTGPHVLRAMEVYRGRLVAYSLGNFMGYRQFGTGGGYGGTTVILEADLAANGALVRAKLHPIALDSESVPHPDPTGLAWDHVRELSAADFPRSGVTVGEDGTLAWR
jgi:poly-gamma-glutamate capsule biosynthesis protein CapA/YwtB (metallophosphatase superfamily)